MPTAISLRERNSPRPISFLAPIMHTPVSTEMNSVGGIGLVCEISRNLRLRQV